MSRTSDDHDPPHEREPRPRHEGMPGFEEREYYSRALGRTQPYALHMPEGADTPLRRYPLLLLLHGRTGCWRDWPRFTRIARYLAGKELIVVCPDGDDGWYTNALHGGERREDNIVQDLVPHLEETLPLLPYPARAIQGLSMGGYGAVKLALKHAGLFSIAVSHSGAFDVTARPEPNPVFGDPARDAAFRARETVAWLAEQALCRLPTQRPKLFLDCGRSDPLIGCNRALSQHLDFIGYGHSYKEMAAHHTWPYWDRAFRMALPAVRGMLRG